MSGDFKIGCRVVQPSLNSIVYNGTVMRLEPKMMDVLVCLAEKQGEVISKEQLIRTVWANTFVTDDVLTRCISELRRALQNDPKGSQVIQTIPKRGYRLVAAVQPVAPAQAANLQFPRTAEARGRISAKGRWLFLGGTAVVVGAIFTGTYLFRHRGPVLTSKDPIIVADFTNTTGDPVFDGALRQGLVAQLEQSPYLDIRSDDQIAGTLRLMGQPPGTQLTHALARQVCQRMGGAAVLDGSISQIGNQYSLVLNALNCSSGALLASAQAVASNKNRVLGALGTVASLIREKLGESLASIGKFNTPLEEVTTPSLEALQAYSVGWHANLEVDSAAAISSHQLQRAVSLDQNFAMAYAVLGTSYYNLNENGLAAENIKKAYDLRDRVSEREKFYISQLSNGRHTEAVAALTIALAGRIAHARKLADDLTKRFPQDTVMQFHYLPTIGAAIALGQKSPAKAITDLQAASSYELGTPALLIFVNFYPVYVRGQAYLATHQGAGAAAEFQKILDHRGIAFNEMIFPLAHLGLGRARALMGDLPGARKAYQDFFSLWQHADPTLPILRQAKAEYAKLPQ